MGTILARALVREGHDVVVLSRGAPISAEWRTVPWDARNVEPSWTSELEAADVVINLAGRSVNCRYTEANKREIMESRVESTRAVGEAVANCTKPPRVWLQASTATIYAHRFDAPNDDVTGIIGGAEADAPEHWQFSTNVAKAWEAAALERSLPSTRLVLLRSSMIMNPDSGSIFATLQMLARLGLGGSAAGGKQFVSWIHEHDFVQSVLWLIANDAFAGPVAIASPNPLPYSEFMRELRHAVGMPIGLPASQWMLEIGALAMRSETELVLKSRRVVPTLLLRSGFTFRYPEWREAVAELVERRGSSS